MGGKGGDSGGGGGGSAVYDPETDYYYVNGIALNKDGPEAGGLSGKTREQILAERAPAPAPVAAPVAAPVVVPEEVKKVDNTPTPAVQTPQKEVTVVNPGAPVEQPKAADNPLPTTGLSNTAPAGPATGAPAGGTGTGTGTTGDILGSAVIKPPTYWVGGINTYNKNKNNTSGSIKTTQT